jgi:hypothetical protein
MPRESRGTLRAAVSRRVAAGHAGPTRTSLTGTTRVQYARTSTVVVDAVLSKRPIRDPERCLPRSSAPA